MVTVSVTVEQDDRNKKNVDILKKKLVELATSAQYGNTGISYISFSITEHPDDIGNTVISEVSNGTDDKTDVLDISSPESVAKRNPRKSS